MGGYCLFGMPKGRVGVHDWEIVVQSDCAALAFSLVNEMRTVDLQVLYPDEKRKAR